MVISSCVWKFIDVCTYFSCTLIVRALFIISIDYYCRNYYREFAECHKHTAGRGLFVKWNVTSKPDGVFQHCIAATLITERFQKAPGYKLRSFFKENISPGFNPKRNAKRFLKGELFWLLTMTTSEVAELIDLFFWYFCQI